MSEELVIETDDIIYLSRSIIDSGLNLSWGLILLKKSIGLTHKKPNSCYYTLIADTIAGSIGDINKAFKYYKLAEKYAVRPNQIRFVAESVLEELHDNLWYEELMHRVFLTPDIISKN